MANFVTLISNETFSPNEGGINSAGFDVLIFNPGDNVKINNNTIINNYRTNGVAIRTDGQKAAITNLPTGAITSDSAAISVLGTAVLNNHGLIASAKAAAILVFSAGNKIVNHFGGAINGVGGVYVGANKTIIENSGSLSGNVGVFVDINGGDFSVTNHTAGGIGGMEIGIIAMNKGKIVNGESGWIGGGVAAIRTEGNGQIDLDNRGVIRDKILLTSPNANDKIVNTGKINADVQLGPGNDTFVFAGGRQGTVFGEAGADRFSFKTELAPKKHVAKIGDFTPGEDTFGVSKALFKKIGKEGPLKNKYFESGKKANDKDDRFLYNKKNGDLFYDQDGSGAKHKPVLIAQIDKGLKLKAGDFIVEA